jgi:hypothetical protein
MYALRMVFVAAAIAAIGCAVGSASPSTLKVNLYAQNRPGRTGTATFEQVSGGVKIVVKVPGGQNSTQPAHIHTGTCEKLNPVPAYALTNIVDGSSTTTLSGTNLGELLEGNYVIDVHESSADIERYVACAPIAIPVAG